MQGGDRYSPVPESMTIEEILERNDKTVPEDTDNPFCKQMNMNLGFAFSVKYTINKRNGAHHFILEYLKFAKMMSQTKLTKTAEIRYQCLTKTAEILIYNS